MAEKLNFNALDQVVENDPGMMKARSARWSRREANPIVQMSIRMHETSYERFRALCTRERRTNGDMLEELLNHYLKTKSG